MLSKTHSYNFIQLQLCQIINEMINLFEPIISKTGVNEMVGRSIIEVGFKNTIFFSDTFPFSVI